MNIKRGTGIFLMITGAGLIFARLKITGAVIGLSPLNYLGFTGISLLLIGAFFSLEDKVKEKSENFRRRLKMARVSKPLYYVFNNGKEYDRETFRKNLKNTVGDDKGIRKKNKKAILKKDEITRGMYNPLFNNYKIASYSKLPVYAHEFIHHLGDKGIILNDLFMASAVQNYMSSEYGNEKFYKQYESPSGETKESWFKKVAEKKGSDRIRHPENLRALTKKEKLLSGGEIEYSKKFDQTGRDLGSEAAYLEIAVKKRGAGLYFLKLVSEGVKPQKAKEMLLGNYAPLNDFERKYGRAWTRILKRCNVEGGS